MATAAEQVKDILPRIESGERRHVDRTTLEQELDWFMSLANEARRDFETAKLQYRTLQRRESKLLADNDGAKLAACLRMKDQTNPLTDKPFSGSAAQDYCCIDPAYAEHLTRLRDIVFEKDAALSDAVSAKIRAQTAVAAVRAICGWA